MIVDAPRREDIENLNAALDGFRNEMNEKNAIIDAVNKERDDARWQLGEHQQWLGEANNRANSLESALRERDDAIGSLRKEIEELQTVKLEAPSEEQPMEQHIDVNELQSKLQEAERMLAETPKQDDISNLNATVEHLRGEIDEKNRMIDAVNKERDDARWQLGENQQWLGEANERANGFEAALREKDGVIESLRKEVEELKTVKLEAPSEEQPMEQHVDVHELQSKLQEAERMLAEAPKQDDLNNLNAALDHLRNEINEKNRIIDAVNKERDDARWQLGEHQGWLGEANNRANGFESALHEKESVIEELRKELEERQRVKREAPSEEQPLEQRIDVEQLQSKPHDAEVMLAEAPKQDDISNLTATVEHLRGEINEKNAIIDAVNRERDEAKWQLGEHQHWLGEANSRVNGLESTIHEKDGVIETLRKEIDELQTVKLEAPSDEKPMEQRVDVQELQMKLENSERMLAEAPKQDDIDRLNATVERLHGEINEKNAIIDVVNKERDDARWQLGEHEQWLDNAGNRASSLESELREKESAIVQLQKEIEDLKAAMPKTSEPQKLDEQERKQLEAIIERFHKSLQESEQSDASKAEELSSLNAAVESLRNQLSEKNNQLGEVNKQKNDAEWNLGEHRQWLADANNKIGYMENIEREKDGIIDALRREVDELKSMKHEMPEAITREDGEHIEKMREDLESLEAKLREAEQALSEAPKIDDINSLNAAIEALRHELNEKNGQLCEVNKQKNDAEWNLGEHRQWLTDANNKIAYLENFVGEKDGIIDALHKEVDELKSMKPGGVSREGGEHVEKIEEATLVRHAPDEAEPAAGVLTSERVRSLESLVDDLKKEVEEKNAEIEVRHKLKNDAEWSLGEHRQWLENANKRIDELSKALNEKTDAVISLLHDNDELKEKAASLESRLKEVEPLVGGAAEEHEAISTLEEKLTTMRQEECRKNELIDELYRQNHDVEKKLDEQHLSHSETKNRVSQLEKEISELKDESDKATKQSRSESYRMQERCIELEETLKKKELTITSLQREKEVMRKELVLEEHPKKFADIEELEEEYKRLQEKYNVLSELLTATEELLERLQAEKPDISQINAIRRTNEMLRHELEEKNVDIETANKRKADAEWSLGEHREWLTEANARVAELESQLWRTREESDSTIRSLHTESSELRDQNNRFNALIRQLREEVSDLRARFDGEQRRRMDAERSRSESLKEEDLQKKERLGSPREVEEPQVLWTETTGDGLSSLSQTICDLRKELKYQKIIEKLTEQRKEAERSLKEAMQRIAELEKDYEEIATEKEGALQESVAILEHSLELTKELKMRVEEVPIRRDDENGVSVEQQSHSAAPPPEER